MERWFREITDKRIRRGAFYSVMHLIETIMDLVIRLAQKKPILMEVSFMIQAPRDGIDKGRFR